MQRRTLGQLEVSAVGLGCGTMTPFYGEPDRAAGIATIRRAREIGVDLLDTADGYGRGRNEEARSRGGPRAPRRLRHGEQVWQSRASRRPALRGRPA